ARPIRRRYYWKGSGRREGEFDLSFGLVFGRAVRASGAASLGAGAERVVDDGLDGTGAAAAFGAATEAPVDLLGATRKVRGSRHRIADVLVAQHVAGTDDHENPAGLW